MIFNYYQIIEWQYPKAENLNGLEFYALASGAHELEGPDLT